MDLTSLTARLGLKPDATVDQINAAVDNLAGSVKTMADANKGLSEKLDGLLKSQATAKVEALMSAKRIDLSGKDAAIAFAMSNPAGFDSVFPPQAPVATVVPTQVTQSRETPAAMSTQVVTSATAGSPPAHLQGQSQGGAPVPHATKVFNRANALMSAANKAGQPITLRAAMDQAETDFANAKVTNTEPVAI